MQGQEPGSGAAVARARHSLIAADSRHPTGRSRSVPSARRRADARQTHPRLRWRPHLSSWVLFRHGNPTRHAKRGSRAAPSRAEKLRFTAEGNSGRPEGCIPSCFGNPESGVPLPQPAAIPRLEHAKIQSAPI
ncbi:hypothetical protein SKAU_G00147050 [Synaphobranchus kaupii]|uniref:Uncharacterized protein n=1 Tax=Synaphobranchus kaupii TaxID=118154 RepID=A0A9Q1FTT4_SYNKA|nr:hypothetical protein SKAU_G00147050 [Synaphobranchus kaupii]